MFNIPSNCEQLYQVIRNGDYKRDDKPGFELPTESQRAYHPPGRGT